MSMPSLLQVAYVIFVLFVTYVSSQQNSFQTFFAYLVMGSIAFVGALVIENIKRLQKIELSLEALKKTVVNKSS